MRRSIPIVVLGLVVSAMGTGSAVAAHAGEPAESPSAASTVEPTIDGDTVTVVLSDGSTVDDLRAELASAGLAVTVDDELSDRLVTVRTVGADASEAMRSTIESLDGVEAAEHPIPVEMFADAPNDPRFPELWGLAESPTAQGVGVLDAWDRTRGSKNVVVGVVDTGVIKHPDLSKNILPGWDFIDDDDDPTDAQPCGANPPKLHGTHVAGTIAALGGNKTGVVGVAPGVDIVPVRVLDACGSGDNGGVAQGILWAAGFKVPGTPLNRHPAKIINLSLGSRISCSQDSVTRTVIEQVTAAGVIVVAAAGNDHTDAANMTPASCPNVITVAAGTNQGALASFSNFGSVVEITAPGVNILSTYRDPLATKDKAPRWTPGYGGMSGTSMAAPHTAGVLALLASVEPSITPAQVAAKLAATARPFPAACAGCGAGLLDAGRLLASSPVAPSIAVPATGTTWHLGEAVTVGWEDVPIGSVSVELIKGATTFPLASVTKSTAARTTATVPANVTVGSATLRVTVTANSGSPVVLERSVTIAQPVLDLTAPDLAGTGLPSAVTWTSSGTSTATVDLVVTPQGGVPVVVKSGLKSAKGSVKYRFPADGNYTVTLRPQSGSSLAPVSAAVYSRPAWVSMTLAAVGPLSAGSTYNAMWTSAVPYHGTITLSAGVGTMSTKIASIKADGERGLVLVVLPTSLAGTTFTTRLTLAKGYVPSSPQTFSVA